MHACKLLQALGARTRTLSFPPHARLAAPPACGHLCRCLAMSMLAVCWLWLFLAPNHPPRPLICLCRACTQRPVVQRWLLSSGEEGGQGGGTTGECSLPSCSVGWSAVFIPCARSALLLALALPWPWVCRERYPSVLGARVLPGVAQAFGASAREGMKRRGFVRFGDPSERDAALQEVADAAGAGEEQEGSCVCLVPCGGPGLGG